MNFIHSFIFLILFYIGMTFFSLLGLPVLFMPQKIMRYYTRLWLGSMVLMTKYVMGINYKVVGIENLPKGPVIIAAKHQSAWETLAMHYLHFDSAYVLKKELLSIPIFGRYLTKMNCAAVDRNAGASALKELVKTSKEVLAQGRSIVIFPQGTRTAPGVDAPYHPGIAGLYTQANTCVVPVALNSGQFWGKNAFKKTPGTITVEYLEPIPAGLKRRDFMEILKTRLEAANTRIENETTKNRGF